MSESAKRLFTGLVFFVLLVLGGCGDSAPTRTLSLPPATFSLSGTVTAAAFNAVDSDTNNPLTTSSDNNNSVNAQPLSNPVVLGGYLTLSATGVSGDRFFSTTDPEDWYRVTLVAGQLITLTIADHDGNVGNTANPDFDLYLVDPLDSTLNIQTSEGNSRQEMIRVLVSGDYFLLVKSYLGGSNYVLNVSQTQITSLSAALRIEDEFIPNEVILRFKDSAPGVSPQSINSRAAALGLMRQAGRPGAPSLYRLPITSNAISTQGRVAASIRIQAGGNGLRQAKRATLDQVKVLRRRSDVASVDLNYIRRPLLVPDDTYYPVQWNAAMINLPQAWDQTTGNASKVVAVVDTGVLLDHPDLAGRLCVAPDPCAGYDFVADPTSAADGDGIDPDPTDPGGVSLASAAPFHGTHVSGILGAVGNNGAGVAGVDWTTRIMPVRVLGTGEGTSYDVIQGVRYAAGLSNDSLSVPANPATIINLSLGGTGYSQTEQDLFNQLHTAGIFVFAAAGNDTNSIPLYPATYAGVISVSAVAADKTLAPYSNFGAAIDVAAPGGNSSSDVNGDGFADDEIISTSGDGLTTPPTPDYGALRGTSMSVPHVAGVTALMLAVAPNLTPAQFDALLASGGLTEDLGADGAAVRNDQFGYGLIDAHKAVLAAQAFASNGILPPTLSFTPNLLNFGPNTTSLTLSLANAGGGALSITSSHTSATWITLTPSAAVDGLGDNFVTVDRAGLADGVYTGTIDFTTDEPGSYRVNLLMQVGASGVANAGLQTISLLDATTNSVLQSLSVRVDPLSGTYSYSFSGLVPGGYLVISGSDQDHDGQSCVSGDGESCGRYPQLSAPASIQVVDKNLAGLDFFSGF